MAKFKVTYCLIGLLLGVFLINTSFGQTIEIIDKGDDRYHIKIDGKDYLAFTVQTIKDKQFEVDSLKIELKSRNRELTANQSLIKSYEKTNEAYKRNFTIQDSLVNQTRKLYSGYKDLYFDYKSAYSEPWLYFSGGIGALQKRQDNKDYLPVILLGISIKRLSLWSFINNEQSGFIMGVNYPIRFNLSLF